MRSLPQSLNEYPNFYIKNDKKQLKNTFLQEMIDSWVKSEKDIFQKLSKISGINDYTADDLMKASILSDSRTFAVKIGGKFELIMAPISDLFNHNPKSNAMWRYDSDNDCFEIYASKDIKKGKEVSLNYGTGGNSKYLFEYGFTMNNNNDTSDFNFYVEKNVLGNKKCFHL